MWISCDICRFLFADTLVPDIVQVGSQFQFHFVRGGAKKSGLTSELITRVVG